DFSRDVRAGIRRQSGTGPGFVPEIPVLGSGCPKPERLGRRVKRDLESGGIGRIGIEVPSYVGQGLAIRDHLKEGRQSRKSFTATGQIMAGVRSLENELWLRQLIPVMTQRVHHPIR